ncbi:tetratricopeptide repeat protein [Sphingomonas sp. So64.6b]|uniref:SPOR domain-containing protein n=1 Tax=Sphingomonas sp. So64.6b TaxID=2997354 RepID=UPI00160008AD|nr:SPOR domain-containing protein [Sphingomonas sp. So64.6b]QNA83124.1 tetratricopeptide repeat protein [Sphingomonas sp. So64.6b]
MHARRLHILALMASPLSLMAGVPAFAQYEVVQAATPDADALASEMRLLAVNPADLNALIRAGELTLKLDDTTAASGFFARAERLDPRNPRIKAGMGTLLVRSGRPGEALRRFAEAESFRGDVRRFAADRGLAYDLIGEQERAQRDYRLALSDGAVDETIRRYALSLGISGKRDEALAKLEPLLRRSDRAAWRARAFILAMTGDAPGAERIATSMMPGGLAQGLGPFFQRLPQLGAVDRAFAVHFGEVRGSWQRTADARLAPAMPALQPEPGRPVVMASAVSTPPAIEEKKGRRDRKKDKRKRVPDRIQVATVTPPVPLPAPPAYVGPPVSTEVAQEIPGRSEVVQQVPGRTEVVQASPGRNEVAQAAAPTQSQARDRAPLPSVAYAAVRPVTVTAMPAPRREETSQAAQSSARVAEPPTATRSTEAKRDPEPEAADNEPDVVEPDTQPVTTVETPRRVEQSAKATPEPISGPPAEQPVTPASTATAASPAPAASTSYITPAPEPRTPPPGLARGEDSILAKIIANITVPGSELDVEPVQPAPAPVRVAEAAPAAVAAKPLAVAKAAPDNSAAETQALAAQKAADKNASDKRLADKKLADKKIADKKLADAKKAEELKKKNDPKIMEPARIWVQVAGGANETSLAKAWEQVRAKAPAAFKGQSGWTTPLRLTNRVLAGPFKTNDEARAFVNLIAKSGISGFTFTSEAGQKITRLGAK